MHSASWYVTSMKVVIDLEANALVNPTEIWLIVCKDISSDQYYIFRNITSNDTERTRFLEFSHGVQQWIGHNILGYDYLVILSLLGIDIKDECLDTLILSKLIDYPRSGHSIEHYGEEFGVEKGSFSKWNDPDLRDTTSKLYQDLLTYCTRDVDICHKVYLKYLRYILKEEHNASITLEHKFQLVVNDLSSNGFKFNVSKAQGLLKKVEEDLAVLDKEILKAFPPKEVLIREFTPKATKFGTISKTSVPRVLHENIENYEIGKTYKHTHLVSFNPASHKQIIEVLNEAGWKPEDKTQTHIETLRKLNAMKRSRQPGAELDIEDCYVRLKSLEKSGWKINETNLATLPKNAPAPARTLAQRIMLESRRRTLTEWLNLVQDDGRIHGKLYGIGAWTHRMAHQAPNTANIPNELDTQGQTKLLGKEMRSLWQAPKNKLLVGVDAEGIQLRIFAHYIDDKEFTDALVRGKKSSKTDPHSLNQRILGDVCKSRAAAKRFIFALLLGAGLDKLASILGCSKEEADVALDRLMRRYTGFETLKKDIIPADARRGWFEGLDGRAVKIPGENVGERRHLCMSGYLQNGEAVVMKAATIKWYSDLKQEGINFKLVNFVHDEWQTETKNNMAEAIRLAEIQCKALEFVGQELKLKCPLAGSYWNDDHHDYTIGTNWYQTH